MKKMLAIFGLVCLFLVGCASSGPTVLIPEEGSTRAQWKEYYVDQFMTNPEKLERPDVVSAPIEQSAGYDQAKAEINQGKAETNQGKAAVGLGFGIAAFLLGLGLLLSVL